ncbi:hypothetical protein [Nocardioides pocheonensis]|uniref:Uncharacterized protein n=1 Tax=Nocardioides pocheonensis TaxID=661485 RepID=A0A3N0GJV6_9ACTN|nr:hypothetical protein [Nocardioides pocheonensis]RNM12691.1 hypothetical protein EFL26_19020 [Nocardioides pocheonensis]
MPAPVVRLLLVQGAVFAAGGLLLWWFATPVYVDGLSALTSVSWPLLLVPALALAALAGTLAGLCIRFGRRWWLAGTSLVLVSLPALYPPLFLVGKWPGSTVQETNLSDLVAAVLGWALYVVTSSGLTAVVGGQRRRDAHDSRHRG